MRVSTTPTFRALWAYAVAYQGPLQAVTRTADGWLLGRTTQAQAQFLGSVASVEQAFRGLARSGVVTRRQAERLIERFFLRIGSH